MGNESNKWNQIMVAAMAVPGIKVNRASFLQEELSNRHIDQNTISLCIQENPVKHITMDKLDAIAKACIKNHTIKVTSISAAAGIPGGFAMIGTLPADTAQYYYHVLKLAQKLAYIYGYPSLLDENGNLTDNAINVLTVFVGVMFGVSLANQTLSKMSQAFAEQVVKRLPRMALTKTAWYPIIKQIAKWLGIKVTKDSLAKGAAKVVPFLGAGLSGGITYFTFKPQANRLMKHLREDSNVFASVNYEETESK